MKKAKEASLGSRAYMEKSQANVYVNSICIIFWVCILMFVKILELATTFMLKFLA